MDLFRLLERTLIDKMGFEKDSKGPGNLESLLLKTAIYLDIEPEEEAVRAVLEGVFSDDPDSELRNLFGHYLAEFDSIASPSWTSSSSNSRQRRTEVLEKLGFDAGQAEKANTLNPFFDKSQRTIVITEEFEQWYPGANPQPRFYWDNYSRLLEKNSWPKTSILNLNKATDEIITRLDNPLRSDDKRKTARGLVVGYVQSGKTANFTGVVAKSIDSGYKMVIILAGTLNVLRAQTQRRLDKELVGKNNLMHSLQSHDCPPDYDDDPEWVDFVEYSQTPRTRIERLTDSKQDFSSNFAQKLVPMLAYEDREIRDAENLKKMPVKLMVVKKQKTVLEKLIRELKDVERQVKDLPVIVIDDESDQASVNTSDLSKPGGDRTTINKLIIDLLGVFTAPQYIGYTATPAANVLINPDDAKDLFPRDFIVTLPRPKGYMGVSDFYDFDEDWNDISAEDAEEMLNEQAYVRAVKGEDDEDDNLPKAVLSYILAGAIKLFRYKNDVSVAIRHHTMLYHSSVRVADHEAAMHEILRIYRGLKSNRARFLAKLKELYENDFQKVSESKCEFEGPFVAPEFDALVSFIDSAVDRIENSNPVRVVNGDARHEDSLPNFEKEQVWSILIGGAKLSRGYTVEGLTVSYFRRKSSAGDTLMQAGRWFGFRKNFSDVVRLFIGTEEGAGRRKRDLYRDFGDICRDEELFREELRTYTKMEDGQPIRPRDVPPMLAVSGLNPTAANKMRGAETHVKNLGGMFLHKAANISHEENDRKTNFSALRNLFGNNPKSTDFEAWIGSKPTKKKMIAVETASDRVLEFLKSYVWSVPDQLHEEISFIENEKLDSEIDKWLVVLSKDSPVDRAVKVSATLKAGLYTRQVKNGKFAAITDPDHVNVCKELIGLDGVKKEVSLKGLEKMSRTGVLLVYPVVPKDEFASIEVGAEEAEVRLGLGIFFPKNRAPIDTYIRVKRKED